MAYSSKIECPCVKKSLKIWREREREREREKERKWHSIKWRLTCSIYTLIRTSVVGKWNLMCYEVFSSSQFLEC